MKCFKQVVYKRQNDYVWFFVQYISIHVYTDWFLYVTVIIAIL